MAKYIEIIGGRQGVKKVNTLIFVSFFSRVIFFTNFKKLQYVTSKNKLITQKGECLVAVVLCENSVLV